MFSVILISLFVFIYSQPSTVDVAFVHLFQLKSANSSTYHEGFYHAMTRHMPRGINRFSFGKIYTPKNHMPNAFTDILFVDFYNNILYTDFLSNKDIKKFWNSNIETDSNEIKINFHGKCSVTNDFDETDVCVKSDTREIVNHVHLFPLKKDENYLEALDLICPLQMIDGVLEVYTGKTDYAGAEYIAVWTILQDKLAEDNYHEDSVKKNFDSDILKYIDDSRPIVAASTKGIHCNYFSTDPANSGFIIILFLTVFMIGIIMVLMIGVQEFSRL